MKKIALAIVATLLIPTFSFAQSKDEIILKKLDELQKSLDAITVLRKDVNEIKTEVDALKAQVIGLSNELTALKSELSSLKNNKISSGGTKPLRPPIITDNGPHQYAKVKIVNTYHTPFNVCINGEDHLVKARETVVIDFIMPPEFTFKVIGIHKEVQKRTISPNETFTINIHPQKLVSQLCN